MLSPFEAVAQLLICKNSSPYLKENTTFHHDKELLNAV
jgi:hypothetical protein